MKVWNRFDPNNVAFWRAVGLGEGDKGVEVGSLQCYLRSFGYLSREASNVAGLHDSSFDEVTLEALLSYQRFFGLPPSGRLDEATILLMSQPRCGNPDGLRDQPPSGNPWGKNELTFCLQNVPSPTQEPDLDTLEKCRDAFLQGFSIWASEANIPMRFRLARQAESCDIRIGFGAPQCGGDACTDCPPDGTPLGMVYDVGEKWSPNPPAQWPPIDIVAFACHEVGHALGLCRHSSNPGAIMFPTVANLKRHLLAAGIDNDVDRIRAIYL